MKYDIAEKEYCITEIFHVTENFIGRRCIPWSKGRKNDGFIFVLEGTCEYTFDYGDKFSVYPGEILYLANKSVYHMNINCDKYKFIYCDFKFDDNSDRKSRSYKIKNAVDTENVFYRLKSSLSGGGTKAKSMELLYNIYNTLITSTKSEYLASSSRKAVTRAENYIKENLSSPELSVSLLSEMSGMSETYFRSLFLKYYSISPRKYITNLRIQYAKRLMEYNLFTFEEIAVQCGFSTVQYFYRVFKKTTGYTPSEYTKMYR